MAYEPTNYASLIPGPQPVTAPLDALQNEQVQSSQRALAVNQIQQQLRQQAMQQAALNDAIKNPSTQSYNNYLLLNPTAHEAIQAAHNNMDVDTQRQQLQDLAAVQGYLGAKRPDDALAVVQKHIDAAKRADQDTTAYTAIQKLIQSDPDRANALVGITLAGTSGADKMASTLATMGGEQRAQQAEPGKEALTAAQAAEAAANAETKLHPLPKTQSAGLGPDGNPIFYNENAPPPANVGAALGSATNNGALTGFVQQLSKSENNTGNPGAKNPNSTATGDGQFVDKTWQDVVQKYRPDLTQGKSPAQILALRKDSELSAQMIGAYAQDNAQTLGAAGLPVNSATLAMAHKLGPGAAQAVLRAAPDAKLSSVLSADAIRANPQLANITAGQYGQKLANDFGTTPLDVSPGDPNATGPEFLKTLPTARGRMVKAIADGDMAMPPAIGRNAAQSALLLQQVLQYDPTASALNLQTRQATRKDYTSGKSAGNIKALNTLAGHLEELDQSIDGLHNTNFGWFNAPAQAVSQAGGNTDTLRAVARFNGWIAPVASEMTTVLRGSNGAEGDIKNWVAQLKSAKSPVALHQTVQDMVRAAQSRLGALEDSYNNGMAKVDEPLPFLRPSTKDIFGRLAGNSSPGGETVSAAPTATNAQGQRVVYDATSRTWKPG